MSRKAQVVEALTNYFVSKGRVMSLGDYSMQLDKPLPVQTVKRVCGSWVRTLAIVENTYPDKMRALRGAAPEEVSEEAPEKTLKEILAELKG